MGRGATYEGSFCLTFFGGPVDFSFYESEKSSHKFVLKNKYLPSTTFRYSMDLSSYTVEQLQAAIAKAKETQSSNVEVSSTPVTTQVEKEVCDFRPTRANQPACQEPPHVHFGPKGFCKKHARTVQALNAKKDYAPPVVDVPALLHPPQREPTPEPVVAEPPAPVVSKPEPVIEPPVVKEPEPKKEDPIQAVVEKAENEILAASKSAAKPKKPLETPPSVVVKRTIRPNAWGRYECPETHILFNPKTKAAFGVQDHKTGRVLPLKKEHIALCQKYRWKYHDIEDDEEDEVEDDLLEEAEEKSDEEEENVEEEESENDEDEDQEEDEENDEEEQEEEGSEKEENSDDEEQDQDDEEENDEEENDSDEDQYDDGPEGSDEDEDAEICEACGFEDQECTCEIE